MPRINQIQVRRDTAANWTSTNPVLAAGEIGLETNTRKTKFGDGTTAWTSLAYATSGGITSSDTAPSSPSVGDQWFNSSTGKTYVYYDGYWVELDSNGTSATSTGNAIINGAFDIWQRGTSFTPTPSSGIELYSADRWLAIKGGSGGTLTVSRQTFTPGAAPVAGQEGQFFLRFNQSVASTGSSYEILASKIEDVRTLAGQTVTLSFYAKADTTRTFTATLIQNFGSGGSSLVTKNQSITINSGWQRYSFTTTLDSLTGKTIGANSFLAVQFNFESNTVKTIDMWGLQLEAGSTATPFKRNANSLQGELAACQRYYQKYLGILYIPPHYGVEYRAQVQFPTTMRSSPTVTATGYNGGGTQVVSEFITTGGFATGSRNVTSGPYITAYTASAEL